MNIVDHNHGIWSFEEEMTRAFLIVGTKRKLMIDSGWGAFDYPKEIQNISDKPLIYVNTHSDNDHIGATKQFQASAWIHPLELPDLKKRLGQDFTCSCCEDGHCFDLGDRSIRVIHTPGHTVGSISLLDTQTGALFPGDTISSEYVFMTGSHRSMPMLIETLRKLQGMEGLKLLYPSHGPCPTGTEVIPVLRELAEGIMCGVPYQEIRQIPGTEMVDGRVRKYMRSVKVYEKAGITIFTDA